MALETIRRNVAEWPEVRESALSRELRLCRKVPAARRAPRARRLPGQPGIFRGLQDRDRSRTGVRCSVRADEIVLGERLAGQLWPGENPLGRIYRLPGAPARRVIGVAREISLPALDPELDRPEFYLPLNNTSRTLYLSLRCAGACPDPRTIDDRLRRVHPALSGRLVAAGEDAYAASSASTRDRPGVRHVRGVALLTAACGLFSVLSYIARRRRREFGIRQMLGASPRQLRQLILGQGVRVLSFGLGIGASGWMGSRPAARLTSLWRDVLDPLTWTVPLVLLMLTAFAAMWRPCRMAAYVNPVMLIREE